MRAVIVIFVMASVLVYLGIRDSQSTVFKLIVMLPFILVGSGLVLSRRKEEYSERRADAIEIAEQTLSVAKPFVLFLRPFQIDKIEADNPKLNSIASMFVPFYRMMLSSTVSIDDALRYAIPEGLELVAVSRNDDLGAIKLVSDNDDWQNMVRSLSTSAERIVLIPGNRLGTIWEMQLMRDLGLLQKCIFLLVPPPHLIALPEIIFDQVKIAFSTAGISLPDQFKGASLESCDALIFDNSGQIRDHRKGVLAQGFLCVGLKIRKIRRLFDIAIQSNAT